MASKVGGKKLRKGGVGPKKATGKWKNRVKTWSGNKDTRKKLALQKQTKPGGAVKKTVKGKVSSGIRKQKHHHSDSSSHETPPLQKTKTDSPSTPDSTNATTRVLRPKKRVSFASKLSESLKIDEIDKSMTSGPLDDDLDDGEEAEKSTGMETPSVTPQKSILKRKSAAAKATVAEVVDEGVTEEEASVGADILNPSPSKKLKSTENNEQPSTTLRKKASDSSVKKSKNTKSSVEPLPHRKDLEPFKSPGEPKKRKLVQVSRAIKEKLATMDRKERKEFIRQLKLKRKPYSDIAVKAKQIWEKLRSGKTPEEAKEKCVQELRELVKGNVSKLIYAHDTVRVIECLMALNRQEIRTEIFEESRGEVLKMAKSKYARFFMIKMLKYGTKEQRAAIMKSFKGSVPELMRHAWASEIVEYAYNEYADALQRFQIVSEFYGPEYALFQTSRPMTLDEIVAETPEKKPFILRNLSEFLLAVTSKPSLKYSLVHRLLAEYFRHCDSEARSDLIDSLKERVAEIVHTRDGSRAAMHCLWFGSVKERKLIVKSTKGLVMKMAKEEHGHMVLLAILDTVDDTVMVQKTILKEIAEHLDSIVKDKYGQKVILYILNPRDPRHFLKETIAVLALGDNNGISKKDPLTRHKELLEFSALTLLKYVGSNMKELIFDHQRPLLVLQTLMYTKGDLLKCGNGEKLATARRECFEALAEIAAEDFVPCDMENRLHLVEHGKGNFVLVQLLKLDRGLIADEQCSLSEVFADKIPLDQLASWTACNKGTFVLLHMYESGSAKAQEVVKSVVNQQKKKLRGYTFPSAKLIMEKAG